MSWIFSRALVEQCGSLPSSLAPEAESSAGSSSDGGQYAQLNVMPTQHKFWHNGKTMEPSNLSQYGLTLNLLTVGPGMELLTWYLAAFPVRTSAPREKAPALTANEAVYGDTWPGLLAKFDPLTSSWRTAQLSLVEGLDEFSETWPRWGSMRNGVCWERQPPDSLTDGSEFGYLLPTPSGVNAGRNHTMGRVDEWGGSSNPFRGTVIGSMCLPEFEELVMGWPVMWTALTPFETAKFQEWQRQHSLSLPADLSKAA